MKKMNSFIKKNYKLIIGFIIGGIIFGTGVYAVGTYNSSDIKYDNKTSKLTSTNLQGAIDELKEKATTKIAEAEKKCPSGNSCRKIEYSNSNIVAAYQYDSSNCITGEESTCIQIPIRSGDAVAAGTIIKYKVNSSTTKYFHVLHDDKTTLTLQQRENTTDDVAWYADSNDNTKGPLTALSALESATSSWSNVEDQTYTMGTTTFSNLGYYTGCTYSGKESYCNANKYTLDSRTAKARMITLQEATSLGCKVWQSDESTNKSCPKWMNNYLRNSKSYGGTVNDNTDSNGRNRDGYWTMSANSSDSSNAWDVSHTGYVNYSPTTYANLGARAVVEVSK